MHVVLAGLAGLLTGPLWTVLYVRGGAKRHLYEPRWRCQRCGAGLSAVDLVGWWALLRRGYRCAHGDERLSPWALVIELTSVVVFAGLAAGVGPHPALAVPLVAAGPLISLAYIDLERYILPTVIIYRTLPVVVFAGLAAAAATQEVQPVVDGLVGGLAEAAFLLLLALVYPAGMGKGDVRLALILGFVTGFRGGPYVVFLSVAAAFIATSIVGIGLVAFRRRGLRTAVPFGPFLVVGALALVVANPSVP